MSSTQGLYQCRLCLNRTSTRVNVFAGDFPKMLEILTSIKVREGDGLPKYSCTKCAQDVKSALITKRRIIKAHKLLVDSLRRKKASLVSCKVKQVFGEGKTITILDDDPAPSASGLLFSNSRKRNCPPKPIKFVNVNDADTELYDVVERVKSNCEGVTLTKVKQDVTNKEALLQNSINTAALSEDKGFTCEVCNANFKIKSRYKLHLLKHKKTTCDMCGITVRSDNFKKHVMNHTSGPRNCEICGATCKNIESLRSHIFYQHKRSATEFVCEECGKHFRIRYNLELHKKKEHTGIRNFKCQTCGKAFFTNGNLMTHVNMTHKKLRPHICEFCGTGFSSSYALKTHKRQHTNEKPFKCEFCKEGFRQRVSLRSHLKSKHNVEESKDYVCEQCDKGFATSYALSIHARLHMAQKCEVCSESFAGKEYLTNHLKNAHNVIVEEKEKNIEEEISPPSEKIEEITSHIDIKFE